MFPRRNSVSVRFTCTDVFTHLPSRSFFRHKLLLLSSRFFRHQNISVKMLVILTATSVKCNVVKGQYYRLQSTNIIQLNRVLSFTRHTQIPSYINFRHN